MYSLVENWEAYTDKYFLRSRDIIEKDNKNYLIRSQVFIRKEGVSVYGIEQVIEFLEHMIPDNSLRILAVPEGYVTQDSPSVIMKITARAKDLIPLETVILGIISGMTMRFSNEYKHTLALEEVKSRTKTIYDLVTKQYPEREVYYFGARHNSWYFDPAISRAAYEGGASECSTDVGASTFGKTGIGTIPHSLEALYAYAYGRDRAVVESTKAFDKYMPKQIPRVALIDYNNKEITDAIATAKALKGKLQSVRIDTPGENTAQQIIDDPSANELYHEFKYGVGRGVTIQSVHELRDALDFFGFEDVKIIMSSGFGNQYKMRNFIRFEEKHNVRLFDAVGIGGVYESIPATMDVVSLFDGVKWHNVAKSGRYEIINNDMELIDLRKV